MAGTPWNKGKTGEAAGWTPKRRKSQSKRQKAWIKAHPESPLGAWGPQPQSWLTGPDPEVQAHRLRWSRMKAQAKFWEQEWTIGWEDYLDLYKTATGVWGNLKKHYNLTRVDTRQGWHLHNVQMMTRGEAMCRKTKGRKRIVPAGQGKGRHWWRKTTTKEQQ